MVLIVDTMFSTSVCNANRWRTHFARTNDEGRYLICGTNAFKPECREYVEDAGTYLMTKKSKGVGMCSYSPDHNSTGVLVGDQLYAGTVADYQVLYKHIINIYLFTKSVLKTFKLLTSATSL